jgi:hypothetical protein
LQRVVSIDQQHASSTTRLRDLPNQKVRRNHCTVFVSFFFILAHQASNSSTPDFLSRPCAFNKYIGSYTIARIFSPSLSYPQQDMHVPKTATVILWCPTKKKLRRRLSSFLSKASQLFLQLLDRAISIPHYDSRPSWHGPDRWLQNDMSWVSGSPALIEDSGVTVRLGIDSFEPGHRVLVTSLLESHAVTQAGSSRWWVHRWQPNFREVTLLYLIGWVYVHHNFL